MLATAVGLTQPVAADQADTATVPLPALCCFVAMWCGVQNLDDRVLDTIDDVLDSTDLLLIVGTSSVVYPAAGYAPQVAQRWASAPQWLCVCVCTGMPAACAVSSKHHIPCAQPGHSCVGDPGGCSVFQATLFHGLVLGD